MLIHNNGKIVWGYLAFASVRILGMSIVPAGLVCLVKAKRWYSVALLGAFSGVAVATVYVNLAI
jgi:energy-converting hydrogenase Eha subunit C